MMVKNKISVIVPVYNLQDYIEKTVDSICKQSYYNLEIILVDDGSQDNSLQVLNKLAQLDERIKVLQKKNGGVTSARICGIKAATGEWISFVDGDDFIETQMYEVLLDNALKYKADISHCGYQMIFPSRVDYYYNTGVVIEQNNIRGLRDLLAGQLVEPGLWVKLYRRHIVDAFMESGEMDLSIKNNEDLLMNYYLFKQAQKSIFVDKCYYHYILRKDSAATASMNVNKFCDPLKVLKIIERDVKENKELLFVVQNRIAAQLVSMATIPISKNRTELGVYKKSALQELRRRIPQILNGMYSKKTKIVSVWVSLFPGSYQFIHMIYAKVTGVEKKFVVK